MKVTKICSPFPAASIDDFIPSPLLVREAAESFDLIDDDNWIRYREGSGQVQDCLKGRVVTPTPSLLLLDYIATHLDLGSLFDFPTKNVFPDTSHHGGGIMNTPNANGEGGFLGMHVDAESHAINKNWKREYSAVLCISEEYNSSFDLLLHNGKQHARLPYKFNRLNVFKCSNNSWHGFPEITKGLDRKTLGVMFWSINDEEDKNNPLRVKASFNNELSFK